MSDEDLSESSENSDEENFVMNVCIGILINNRCYQANKMAQLCVMPHVCGSIHTNETHLEGSGFLIQINRGD